MELRCAALCEPGFEDITKKEIKELVNKKATVNQGILLFNTKKIEDLAEFCYRSQSTRRILLILAEGNGKNDIFKTIEESMQKINVRGLVNEQTKFTSFCERVGKHDFNSIQMAQHISKLLINQIKTQTGFQTKVDFKNPDVIFFTYINNDKFYIGVDFSGFDLSKREYKVFSHAAALKGTTAYNILRFANYSKEKFLLNCFSKSAVIEIEAALFASKTSVQYFKKDKFAFMKLLQFKERSDFLKNLDKQIVASKPMIYGIHGDLRHITAGNKNAKIAGVQKIINLSRTDVDWIDVKFDDGQADIIIIYSVGAEKLKLPELLKQSKYVLSKEGVLVMVSINNPQMEISGFKQENHKTITRGDTQIHIETFKLSR
jgi:23S rRNA G2445 N2-methylase RlmL